MQVQRSSLAVSIPLALALAGAACEPAEPEADDLEAVPPVYLTGNGAPSGAHYTLNIIGVPKNKSAPLTGNKGSRIFVPLSGSTKINLKEGTFQVLDANGTDGSAAFQ